MKKIAIIIYLFVLQTTVHAQKLTVDYLRCEYRENPYGVEVKHPRLGWSMISLQSGVVQTAYRILVADDKSLLEKNIGNYWDSKKVVSGISQQVEYGGKDLKSATKYYWKVMVWDNKGNLAMSAPDIWITGLASKADWGKAKWIAYEELADALKIVPHVHLNGKKTWGERNNILPLMRKTFTSNKKVKSAYIYVSGLGQFNLYVNAENIFFNEFLNPGWTNYEKQALYVTYDVTDKIRKGVNLLYVELGNGFYYIPGTRYRKMTGAYGLPKLILKLKITYEDGSQEDIITDQSWKTTPSGIIYSSIFGGEDRDANLSSYGAGYPEYDDSHWKKPVVVSGPPVLESQMNEPVVISRFFEPVSQQKISDQVTVYDLGQNFAGIPSIIAKGNRYDTIRAYCGELINRDGTVNQKATGSPSYFTLIMDSSGSGILRPKFSYTGLRYIQVHTIPFKSGGELPRVIDVEGISVKNRMGRWGSFSCSNDLFNKTYKLIDWAIQSNSVSVFTDCPHREKLGWLEQTYLMGPSVQYNYAAAPLFRKVIRDMIYAQHANGLVPEIAPEFTAFTPPFDESPEWGSASIILPWYNYQWYGDKRSLQDAWPMMQRYMDYLNTKDSGNILTHGLGDWYDIGPKKSGFAQMTKRGVTATATYYYDAVLLSKMAVILKKPADKMKYDKLAAQIRQAFNQAFFDKQQLQYDSASQTANAMALYMGLVEEKNRKAVVDALVSDIKSRNNALTAGDIGYRYVLKALEQNGRSDIIFDMNSRDDVPGYGFQLKHGATALTESWQAYESVSNNHFMLGHLMEWFYSGLAGIRQTEESVAFKEVEIRPEPVGDLTEAKASFYSPYGKISSAWKKTDGKFEITINIPANSTAVVYLPVKKGVVVMMNGKKTMVQYQDGKAVLKTGSGEYNFQVKE
jgi:alpha-L-rhamnosidase